MASSDIELIEDLKLLVLSEEKYGKFSQSQSSVSENIENDSHIDPEGKK